MGVWYHIGVRWLAVLPTIALAACDCGRESTPINLGSAPSSGPPESRPRPNPEADAPTTASCSLTAIPLRRDPPPHLVVIGDLHGDFSRTRAALRLAGAIDEADHWIGRDLVVVQTGDVLDRGTGERAIFDLFRRLERDAAAAGGGFIMLLGNHELMNAAGDFRYVIPAALADFDNAVGADRSRWQQAPVEVRGRLAALGPGGPYAKWLAEHNVVAIIGDTVFSHAGVLATWADELDSTNLAARCWLAGMAGGVEAAPRSLTSDDSPLWTRNYGGDAVDCDSLRAVLAKLGARRMVVGHTVQRTMNSACDGALWRIDVGIAAIYNGPLEVLELAAKSQPRVLAAGSSK